MAQQQPQSPAEEPPAAVVAAPPPARARWFWPTLIAMCIGGGVIRFLILSEHLTQNPFASYLRVDALTYWNWGGRIADGQWREATPFFSAPLYPYMVGLIRACGGGLATICVVQIVLDLLTAGLLGGIGRARFGPIVGLVAAAGYLLLLEPASFCLRVLTPSLQLLLVCLAWLALLAVQRRTSLRRSLLAGAAVGLLSLSYPPAMLILAGLVVWLWWQAGRSWRSLRPAAAALLGGAVLIAPAALHNYLASGNLFLIQAASGITLRQGNGPGAGGGIVMIPGTGGDRETLFFTAKRTVEADLGRPVTWAEVHRHYRDEVFDYWRSDPAGTISLFARKGYLFLTSRNYFETFNPALEVATGLLDRLRCTPLHTAWLVPAALVAVAVWLRRAKTYAPELLFFGVPLLVTLLFRYSPRYRLPAIPVIVIGATWVLWQALRHRRSAWPVAAAAALVLAAVLNIANRATGFDALAAVRPEFEYSLGVAYTDRGELEEALTHFGQALELKPELENAALATGDCLRRLGQPEAALARAREVLARNPDSAKAHNLIGAVLAQQGSLDEAAEHLRQAARLDPNMADAHSNLGNILAARRKPDAAAVHYRAALQIRPDYVAVHANLANVLVQQGNFDEALEHYRAAIYLDPEFAPAHYGLGSLQLLRGDPTAAAAALRQTLKLQPQHRGARASLAYLLLSQQDYGGAAALLREGCELAPDDLQMANDLAWLLATCPEPPVRSPEEALALATRVRQAMDRPDANKLDTLAAAYAAAGRFAEAVEVARQAIERATAAGDPEQAERIRGRLRLYEAGQPFRDQPPP